MQAYLEAVTLFNNLIHLVLSIHLARMKIVDIDDWRHLTYRAVCIALWVEAWVTWFDAATGCWVSECAHACVYERASPSAWNLRWRRDEYTPAMVFCQ